MAGKNIGVIVSSASSGISGVVADAKRLIPDGKFLEPNLWIRSSQTSNAASLISDWLDDIHYNELTSGINSIASDTQFSFSVSDGQIDINGNFETFSLYSLSGNKVIEASCTPIHTYSLPAGIYIAMANTGYNRITKKINIR